MKVPSESRHTLESLGDNEDTFGALAHQMTTGSGITPFVGAGMSVALNYPGWGHFLTEISRGFGIEATVTAQVKSGQFEEAAQTCLKASGPGAFQDAVLKTFGPSRIEDKPINSAVRLVPKFARGPVVTTNFDRVLETVFERARKPFEERVWGVRAGIAVTGFYGNRRYLLKLHGDVIDTSDRILTQDEYEKSYGAPGQRYHDAAPPLHSLIRFIMANRPLLFLGCSLNADRITGFLEEAYQQYGQLLHYAIVEQPATKDDYERRRKNFWSLGIRPIWFPTGRFDLIESVLLLAIEHAHTGRRCSFDPPQIRTSPSEFNHKVRFACHFSDVSEIDDINESVLSQLSEIGHRELDEFNIDNTIHKLFETNSVGIHCWSTIKQPGTVIAFFILAPITGRTCKQVLEKKIRGAKQLGGTAFVRKAGSARGIYILSIVSTSRRYHGYLMKHLKEEIALLLTHNPGIEYIFTRPINAHVAFLATKYGFTPISESPSPIYVTTRSEIRLNDELGYPWRGRRVES
jgi:SIR2-like domain